MADKLSDSVRKISGLNPSEGRQRYKDLYNEEIARRVEEQAKRAEAFEETVKSMNGLAQLAMQQAKQLAQANKNMREIEPPPEDEEVKG